MARKGFFAKGNIEVKRGDILVDFNDVHDQKPVKYFIFYSAEFDHMAYEIIETSIYKVGFRSPLVRIRPRQMRRMEIESRGNSRKDIEKLLKG